MNGYAETAAARVRTTMARRGMASAAATITVALTVGAVSTQVEGPTPLKLLIVSIAAGATLLRQLTKKALGALTSWALLVPVFATLFAALDVLVPTVTGCSQVYVDGCSARSALESAAAGGLIPIGAWLVFALPLLVGRGTLTLLAALRRLRGRRAKPAGSPTPVTTTRQAKTRGPATNGTRTRGTKDSS